MAILLHPHSHSRRHARIAQSLRIGKMLLASSVNVVSFSTQWREAFATRFFVSTLGLKGFNIIRKFIIFEEMLAFLTHLVVRVGAKG